MTAPDERLRHAPMTAPDEDARNTRAGRGSPAAGLARRLAALLYDALVLAALFICYTVIVLAWRGGQPVPPGTWWFPLSLLALTFLFFGYFWTHGGQTLGMRTWKLRVERTDGEPLRWTDAGTRWLAAWLSWSPAGLGYWWSLLDRERRCWHDRLSATRVVHERPRPQ